MAARTSTSVGVAVTITILGVASLALFITTVVFLAKWQAVTKELNQTEEDNRDFISDAERARDDIRNLLGVARNERKSLVAYLVDQKRDTMNRVTGSGRDSFEDLQSALDGLVSQGTTVVGALESREREITQLESEVEQARANARAAQEDLQNETNSKLELIKSHEEVIARLQAQVEQQRQEVEQYRSDVGDSREFMEEQISIEREQAAVEIADLESRLADRQREILNLQEQLRGLRRDTATDRLTPAPEESLADGNVLDVYPAQREVVVNRGREDKVILGMLFSVYDQNTRIRPNPVSGEYPRGKAAVEIIGIDPTTARGRIVSEIAGNAVVAGDVIVNPFYDPDKVYKFVVYGNFDTDGDGVSTARERTDVSALIKSWNGVVEDDLSGDTDFLVLGNRPVLPPEPPGSVPIEVIREWVRLREAVDRYDELLEGARSTSIPVLNQNRLRTLIGM